MAGDEHKYDENRGFDDKDDYFTDKHEENDIHPQVNEYKIQEGINEVYNIVNDIKENSISDDYLQIYRG